jgi:hypothetical protein
LSTSGNGRCTPTKTLEVTAMPGGHRDMRELLGVNRSIRVGGLVLTPGGLDNGEWRGLTEAPVALNGPR